MTRQILDLGGVVGDFHGDAAMGFWGWPLDDDQRVIRACRAALSIRTAFKDAASLDQHALAGFRVGMGLATGEAVAGKLGTVDQVKVTAFGPVVNLASRLEGLTGTLGVSILVDRATARIAQQGLPATLGHLRYVARLQPYGMEAIEDVYELVPSRGSDGDAGHAHGQTLREALDAFQQGDWGAAQGHFQNLAPDDPIRDFYLRLIGQQGPAAPADWDGVIRFRNKP
jgi:adenylate cyclase